MSATYHIDPARYSLKRLRADLETRELIPSRLPLKEGLKERFEILESLGITSLDELIKETKTRAKLQGLAEKSGIPEGYLVLLRREANSYLPNPVSLARFEGIPPRVLEELDGLGIKNSRHLYQQLAAPGAVPALAKKHRLPEDRLSELLALSDLARAYGVGPVFARLLYQAGIQSLDELVQHSPDEIIQLYEERTGKKADFTESDLRFSINLSRVLVAESS